MIYLKSAQLNMQYSLILELMLYKFELGHKTGEVLKNICWVKSEGAVDHSTKTKWFVWVARTSTIKQGQIHLKLDSEAMLQAIESNLASYNLVWFDAVNNNCNSFIPINMRCIR